MIRVYIFFDNFGNNGVHSENFFSRYKFNLNLLFGIFFLFINSNKYKAQFRTKELSRTSVLYT